MIHFPNEILSIIINELTALADEKDSLAALASCRLTCHTFCSIATPLLFSSITLTDDEPSYYTGSSYEAAIPLIRAVNLNEILIHKQDIATSVRTLVLKLKSHTDLIGGDIIASILARLPYIEALTLEVLKSNYPLEWNKISRDLSSAIQALFRSDHLTKLDLFNFSDFPLILITNCTNLQYLRLSRIRFSVKSPLFIF